MKAVPFFSLFFYLAANFVVADEKKSPSDDFEMVKRLHARAVAAARGVEFSNYRNTCDVFGAEMEYEMVAIKGGIFTMGSDRKDRPDENPPHRVKVDPFWMGKYEVTWDWFEPYSITATPRNKEGIPVKVLPGAPDHYVVSKPTAPYTDMSFGMGKEGFPAVSMTQHAASKFCQWLSALTGHFYRLPTEAEWEYACRAGTTGKFSCPEADIFQYAVCEPDIDNPKLVGYEKVGTLKPNPWGLYDMHGNVMEWCLDQYNSVTYGVRPKDRAVIINPFIRANRIYPRVARGGSWYDPPDDCRSARRYYSEPDWKQQDPELPKSYWYHTDAAWLGFRVVRPFEVPSPEEMDIYWNSAHPERVKK